MDNNSIKQNHNSNHKDINRKENGDVKNQTSIDKNDKRFWIVVALLVVIGIVIWVINSSNGGEQASSNAQSQASSSTAYVSSSTDSQEAMPAASYYYEGATSSPVYTYSCDNDNSITATFHLPKDDFVNVHLSDGRSLILAHVISADGARYANFDQSFVFWTKGVTAFIQENGTTTYANCVVNRFP